MVSLRSPANKFKLFTLFVTPLDTQIPNCRLLVAVLSAPPFPLIDIDNLGLISAYKTILAMVSGSVSFLRLADFSCSPGYLLVPIFVTRSKQSPSS